MPRLRVSLASKCQIMFGAALLLILAASLSVPWMRMQDLVAESQRQIADRLADAWLQDLALFSGPLHASAPPVEEEGETDRPLRLYLIDRDLFEIEAAADPFIREALEQLQTWDNRKDVFRAERREGRLLYRYARAIRLSDLEPSADGDAADADAASQPAAQEADPLRSILLIEMSGERAAAQVRLNRIYLAAAGLLAGALAIAVFWYITTRIVLSPLRVLKDTAEKVAEGDLNIRADINTGDEFEQLSDTFNEMLGSLKSSQDKLRDLNRQLDLKLGELAQSNVSLYEANRIKGDFLANVSHELRTPLNSIIGFAEVLGESLDGLEGGQREKVQRYVDHIAGSSRSLLQMINELLDLAKIEAGRMELHVEPMSLSDVCESLLNLIRPQADRKKLRLVLSVPRDLPVIRTDPGKLQQILFNFLSNAVKFTPEGGRIELGAEPVADERSGEAAGARVWVSDTGPGIPPDRHEEIFDKFRQLDSSHTKPYGGSGLGLAISRELARLIDARIDLDSDIGRGATFRLTVPLALEAEKVEPLMPDMAS